MMDLLQYIVDEALIVIPALWVIGAILKRTPNIPDWTIAYVLLLLGVVSTVSLLGFSPQSVVQGVLVTGAAVLGHQLVKQAVKGGE